MASDWWANKLANGNPPASSSPSTPSVTPYQGTPYRPQQGNSPVTYDPNRDQLLTSAQSEKTKTSCPNCYSGNYMKVGVQSTQSGSFDVMRCYDCGYPKVQQGSGAGLPSSSSGSATPAKQPSQGNGFNPNVIVDRIG
jgi:hypothetical protein